MNNNHLRMCFAIKVDDRFYSEHEIANNLDKLKYLAEDGKLDLETTDGNISVKQGDKEYYGNDLWDSIYWILHDFIASLDKICIGETVESYSSMQSCTIRLTRKQQQIRYQLVCKKQRILVQHDFPFAEFMEQLLLLSWRLMRTLSELGADFDEALANWRTLSNAELDDMIDFDKISRVMNDPIIDVLKENSCK